jgi:hypothetical protein
MLIGIRHQNFLFEREIRGRCALDRELSFIIVILFDLCFVLTDVLVAA